MKQPAVTPKKPSNAWILLVISIVLVALSIAGFAVFINLNRTIKMTFREGCRLLQQEGVRLAQADY